MGERNRKRLIMLLEEKEKEKEFSLEELFIEIFEKGWYDDWRNTYYNINGTAILYASPSLVKDLEKLEEEGIIKIEKNTIKVIE